MTITLPEEMREWLEERAKSLRYPTVDAYVSGLIAEDFNESRDDGGEIPEPPPGASYVVNSRQELEAKILEGLNSGPVIEVTPAFWEDLRKRVDERLANSAR